MLVLILGYALTAQTCSESVFHFWVVLSKPIDISCKEEKDIFLECVIDRILCM